MTSRAGWMETRPSRFPPERKSGRNAQWGHLDNRNVIAVPDKWEFPWYAAWDLAFHAVVLAHIDPAAAKHQLLLLSREWYMHPSGKLPAYEWAFGDVNPPVHAWAALKVFPDRRLYQLRLPGPRLSQASHQLHMVVNRGRPRRQYLRGRLSRTRQHRTLRSLGHATSGELLEQSDGTAWIGTVSNMLRMALQLRTMNQSYEGVAVKFFEHFASIAAAMKELWDEEDGFFYDRLRKVYTDGSTLPLRARSMVGLLPIFAAVQLSPALWERLPEFRARAGWFIRHKPQLAGLLGSFARDGRLEQISLVDKSRLRRVLAHMLDEAEFLSPYGLRSLSRYHRDHPLVLALPGCEARLDYEPAESTTALFGGSSNWRGPIWFPLNFLRSSHCETFMPGLAIASPSSCRLALA